MTYGASPPPPPPPIPPPPQPRRFLGMRGWVLGLVVTGVILVFCIAPISVILISGAILDLTTPDPDAAIVSCEVTEDEVLPTADVQWEVTNNGNSEESYTVTVTVLDGNGRQIGDTRDFAFRVGGGATVSDTVKVFLDAPGGETCEISVD